MRRTEIDYEFNREKFDMYDPQKYVGKWCLMKKEYAYGGYERVFVDKVSDGIIKYSCDKKKWFYDEISEFKHCKFFISPVDNDDKETWKSDVMCDDVKPVDCSYNTTDSCPHDWQEMILLSKPSVKYRVCRKCGKQQHLMDINETGDLVFRTKWVDGLGNGE